MENRRMRFAISFCLFLCFLDPVYMKRKFTVEDLGNLMALAKDRTSRIVSARSHMDCMCKCAVRSSCHLYSSNTVPPSKLTPKGGFKCGLTREPETYITLYNLTHACETMADLMVKIPSAIGGACSDHTCSDVTYCKPKPGGGYSCRREKGRAGRIKPK